MNSNFIYIILIVSSIILMLTSINYIPIFSKRLTRTSSENLNEEKKEKEDLDVLLIYIYSNSHKHAFGNLKYFIDTAVRENDGVDYYFILQKPDNKTIDEDTMPFLISSNARYIQHENVCFDFGTTGWFLKEFTYGNPWINQKDSSTRNINLKKYKYYILLNSSVRGPYLPPYFNQFASDYQKIFNKIYSWSRIFTDHLNTKVKLVGSTLSCQIIPHVQSYILATDWSGLVVLLQPGAHGGSQEGGIFQCFTHKPHVSGYSELPSSTRIREAGYRIDSLLTKYQDVDFNDARNHGCGASDNPCVDQNLDGLTLEPYEVLFVKFNEMDFFHLARERATLYQNWAQDIKNEAWPNL